MEAANKADEQKTDAKNQISEPTKSSKSIREWLSFCLALIGSVLGLLGFLGARGNSAINNKMQATIILNEAWDIISGGEGTENVDVAKFVKDRRQLELARRKVETAKTLAPNYAKVFTTEGAYFIARDQLDQAITSYQTAIRLDPSWNMPHNNLGGIFVRQEKWNEAIVSLKKASELDPKDPQPPSNICYALWKQRKLEEAVNYCQQSIMLDPGFILAYDNLANVLLEQGKVSEATKVMEERAKATQQIE